MPKTALAVVADHDEDSAVTLSHYELSKEMQHVIKRIGNILEKTQAENLRALWLIGSIIVGVRDNPEKYLTAEQAAAHIDGEAVIASVFSAAYSPEHLRGAVLIFEAYPSTSEIDRLLTLRCPARPMWRISATHAQLLAQIPDDDQRAAVENRCAAEAYSTRSLAIELKELRGSKRAAGAGRPHEVPKGLKNQLLDLIQHQRRFISRSERLWLNEDSDNIYDEIANTPPGKFTDTILEYFQEISDNFLLLQEAVDNHRAMCRKLQTEIFDKLARPEAGDDDTEDAGSFSPARTFSKIAGRTKKAKNKPGLYS